MHRCRAQRLEQDGFLAIITLLLSVSLPRFASHHNTLSLLNEAMGFLVMNEVQIHTHSESDRHHIVVFVDRLVEHIASCRRGEYFSSDFRCDAIMFLYSEQIQKS